MDKRIGKVSVFEYDDYRTFLKDWFKDAKERNPSFSYRALSKKADFRSSNFFMLVMQGKRNLSEESIKHLVIALNLNRQEEDFFRNLVFFNQAHTLDDKNFYYQKLLQSRKFRELKPIEKERYEYYSMWYHPVVREMVVAKDFDGTPKWISDNILPPITPVQAERSIELLERLGFIKKVGPRRWKQESPIISTGPELRSVVVHNYHKALLDLSKGVMDNLSVRDRETSALTLGVKRERLGEIKRRIREFRQEILKMASEDSAPEEVAQLNIQFFPVTRIKKGGI